MILRFLAMVLPRSWILFQGAMEGLAFVMRQIQGVSKGQEIFNTYGPLSLGTTPGHGSQETPGKLVFTQHLNSISLNEFILSYCCCFHIFPTSLQVKCLKHLTVLGVGENCPPGNDHIFPPVWHFWVDDFPFTKVGYLSFQQGNHIQWEPKGTPPMPPRPRNKALLRDY